MFMANVRLGSTKFWTFRHFLPLKNWNKTKIRPCYSINISLRYRITASDFRFNQNPGHENCHKVKKTPFLLFLGKNGIHWIFSPPRSSFYRPRFFRAMHIHYIYCAKKFGDASPASLREIIRWMAKFWPKFPGFPPLSCIFQWNFAVGGPFDTGTKR